MRKDYVDQAVQRADDMLWELYKPDLMTRPEAMAFLESVIGLCVGAVDALLQEEYDLN